MAYRVLANEINNEDILKRVRAKERVLLQSPRGKTIGAIISAKELKMLERFREEEIERLEDEEDCRDAERIMEEIKSGKAETISLEDLLKKYGPE